MVCFEAERWTGFYRNTGLISPEYATTQAQLTRLIEAMKKNPKSKVFIGFNRPKSPLFKRLQALLARESGSLMINWFVALHEVSARGEDSSEEGSPVVTHLCHWSDLSLHLVTMEKAFPCTIVPTTPVEAKSGFVASIMFSDCSCASITFSAKGHVFEALREVLNIHKGNLLATLTDFRFLNIEVVEKKKRISLLHCDRGHEANIVHSFRGVTRDGVAGENWQYISATAKLYLAIREPVDSRKIVTLSREEAIGGFL